MLPLRLIAVFSPGRVLGETFQTARCLLGGPSRIRPSLAGTVTPPPRCVECREFVQSVGVARSSGEPPPGFRGSVPVYYSLQTP